MSPVFGLLLLSNPTLLSTDITACTIHSLFPFPSQKYSHPILQQVQLWGQPPPFPASSRGFPVLPYSTGSSSNPHKLQTLHFTLRQETTSPLYLFKNVKAAWTTLETGIFLTASYNSGLWKKHCSFKNQNQSNQSRNIYLRLTKDNMKTNRTTKRSLN